MAIETLTQTGLHRATRECSPLYQLANAIDTQLNNLNNMMNRLDEAKTINGTWGDDIDNIGNLLDAKRKISESDVTFKARLNTYVTTRSAMFQTVTGIQNTIKDITGYTVTIEEYPTVDFKTEYGISTNYACFRALIPISVNDLIPDIKSTMETTKAAGVASFIESYGDFIESLTLTEIFSGEINGYFTETITTFDEVMAGIIFFLESYNVSIDESMVGFINGYFVESTLILSEIFSGEISGSFADDMATLTDIFIGNIDMEPFIETFSNYIPFTIGTSTIGGTHVLDGFVSEVYNTGEWDSSFWDVNIWDGSVGLTVMIKELF